MLVEVEMYIMKPFMKLRVYCFSVILFFSVTKTSFADPKYYLPGQYELFVSGMIAGPSLNVLSAIIGATREMPLLAIPIAGPIVQASKISGETGLKVVLGIDSALQMAGLLGIGYSLLPSRRPPGDLPPEPPAVSARIVPFPGGVGVIGAF